MARSLLARPSSCCRRCSPSSSFAGISRRDSAWGRCAEGRPPSPMQHRYAADDLRTRAVSGSPSKHREGGKPDRGVASWILAFARMTLGGPSRSDVCNGFLRCVALSQKLEDVVDGCAQQPGHSFSCELRRAVANGSENFLVLMEPIFLYAPRALPAELE